MGTIRGTKHPYIPHPAWEPCDDGYLRAFFGEDSVDDIARALHRSVGSVRMRAKRLGLLGRHQRNWVRPDSTGVLATELDVLRLEYARLQKSEQQAREQIARLVVELNKATRAQMPAEVTAVAPLPLPTGEDRALRKRDKAQRKIIGQLCIMLACERGRLTLDVAQTALRMTSAEYARAADLAVTGGVNACLGKAIV